MTVIEKINALKDELTEESYLANKEYWDALAWEIEIQQMESASKEETI